ncbi:hypothetical protein MML48_9g00005580 [Holotrichia oblita]|uniref:Uncharacterized protein n=1 Tax=Holotrichia oblita TaxID=644536 RepID=A0ACB9SJQ2_HOLOL|nr:hypothetical protein MML48_9g00005580 [Holotrichia oblita]
MPYEIVRTNEGWVMNNQGDGLCTKDNKVKTGRGPVRFAYFDRLDELLGDKPINCSPHSIDVAEVDSVPSSAESDGSASALNNEINSNEEIDSNKGSKRKNPSMELIKIKKAYYEKRTQQIENKEEVRKKYINECINNKNERLNLLKRKLELEERKIIALENLANKN